jgi:hypothetical protein
LALNDNILSVLVVFDKFAAMRRVVSKGRAGALIQTDYTALVN